MAARESAAVERACAVALANPTWSLLSIADEHGIAVSSLRRALRLRGAPPRAARSGQQHHAFIDGRTAAARPGRAGKRQPPAPGSAAA